MKTGANSSRSPLKKSVFLASHGHNVRGSGSICRDTTMNTYLMLAFSC